MPPFTRSKKALLLPCGLLAVTLLIFETTTLDLWLQDRFYSPETHSWLIAKNSVVPRFLFYHAPKILLIAFGAWILCSLVVPRTWRARRFLSRRSRREIFYLLICLGLFPAFIAGVKKTSGLHCPSELFRYGGEHHYRKLFSKRPSDPRECGHCFPAGHASGGFALWGLYFVAKTPRSRKFALASALAVGWAMGMYQMLNGSHFLSHTVVTMLLAWIFTLSFALLLRVPAQDRTTPDIAGQ